METANKNQKRISFFRQLSGEFREDLKGTVFSLLCILSVPAIIGIILSEINDWGSYSTSLLRGIGSILLAIFIVVAVQSLLLKLKRLTPGIASLIAFVVTVAFAFALGVAGAGAAACAGAGAGAVAGVLAFPFAVAFAGALALAVAFVYTFAFAFAFAGALAGFVAFAGASAVMLIGQQYLLNLSHSINLYKSEIKSAISSETKVALIREMRFREKVRKSIYSLITNKTALTFGLAGRRGIGKTAAIERLRCLFNFSRPRKIDKKQDMTEVTLKKARIKRPEIIIKSPTAFEEKGFLMSVFECLAREVDRRLSFILPPVRPIREQRIHERIAHLRGKIHAFQIILLSIIIICLIFLGLRKGGFFPVAEASTPAESIMQPQYETSADSLLKEWRWLPYIFFKDKQNELKQLTEPERNEILMQFFHLDSLLALKEKNVSFWAALAGDDTTGISIDSALVAFSKTIPDIKTNIDSLKQTVNSYLERVNTVQSLAREYGQIREEYDKVERVIEFRTPGGSGRYQFEFLAAPAAILIIMLFVLWRKRSDRMDSKHYDAVRQEIMLYHATRDVLDRLHHNMSISESAGSTLSLGASYKSFGLGWGRSRTRQVTRAAQPFSLQSLIDAYKQYVQDVRRHLAAALKESGYSERRIKACNKILICIDELDKVLDPEKLHNMLKSLKAIFELEGVYYVLSISEDALESYELRGLQIKNEVDSTFTHISKLPPMEVDQCRQFYRERDLPVDMIPVATVYGGGVPRDMNRIMDTYKLNPNWVHTSEFHTHFIQQEKESLINKIRNHPRLSTILKKNLEDAVEQIVRKKPSVKGVEKILIKEDFMDKYPGTEEEAKKDYYTLLALMQAFSVRIQIQVMVEGFLAEGNSIDDKSYRIKIDHLRQAVYLLGESPFAAEQELEEVKKLTKPIKKVRAKSKTKKKSQPNG